MSKVFKITFDYVENFHRKSFFYICFKKFWVVESSYPIVTKLLSEVKDSVFKLKTRSRIGFSKTSI